MTCPATTDRRAYVPAWDTIRATSLAPSRRRPAAIRGLQYPQTAGSLSMARCSAVLPAQGLGASVEPFAVAVMFCDTCAFATPMGHQTNLLVMGPAGRRRYRLLAGDVQHSGCRGCRNHGSSRRNRCDERVHPKTEFARAPGKSRILARHPCAGGRSLDTRNGSSRRNRCDERVHPKTEFARAPGKSRILARHPCAGGRQRSSGGVDRVGAGGRQVSGPAAATSHRSSGRALGAARFRTSLPVLPRSAPQF